MHFYSKSPAYATYGLFSIRRNAYPGEGLRVDSGHKVFCPAMRLSCPVRRFVFFLLFIMAASAAFAAPRHIDTGFLNRHVAVNGTVYKYQVYLPEGWTEHGTWPIILFLHGSGERGSEGM